MTRLVTDDEGPGSLIEIERYIATVLRERTNMKPDTKEHPATTPERLARAIRTSVLHRLGYVDWRNPYKNISLETLTHEQIVALIEDVQYLRDLATLELARRDPDYPPKKKA